MQPTHQHHPPANPPGTLGLVLLAGLALTSPPAALQQPAQTLLPVAEQGQPAPVPGGLLFEMFGAHDSALFGVPFAAPPSVDLAGHVAFHAFLGTDGIPDAFGFEGPNGIFRSSGGVLETVALTGDPAPGVSGGTFFGLVDTPLTTGGGVTFRGVAQTCLSSSTCLEAGIWTTRNGPLELVLLEGQQLPGMPVGFSVLEFAHDVPDGESIVVDVRYEKDAAVFLGTEFEGFWRDRGQGFQLIAIDGMQAPGTAPGVVFDEHEPLLALGPFDNWFPNRKGEIVFMGFVAGPGVFDSNDEGFWGEDPTGLRLVAREGDPAPSAGPGFVFGSSTGFRSFTSGDNAPAHRNDEGRVFFGATLHDPVYTHWRSIWTDRSGTLECLAKGVKIPVGGVLPQADQAPGFPDGWDFSHFTAGFLNNQGTVAFHGFVDNQSFPAEFEFAEILDQGIWWDAPGALTLVAGEGLAVAAIPGATFTSVGLVRLSEDSDTLWYFGSLAGPAITSSNDLAFFRVDPDGSQHVVLRQGDLVDVGGDGTDLRTVSSFGVGGGDHVSTAGERVFEVFFPTSTGVYVAQAQPVVETYGCGVNPAGSLTLLSGLPSIGSTVVIGVDNPLGTQPSGSLSLLGLSLAPNPSHPCGTVVPGLGMAGPGSPGEILISLGAPQFLGFFAGPPWAGPGSPAPIPLTIPDSPGLIGVRVFAQGAIRDPAASLGIVTGLSEAIEMRLAP